MLMVVLFIAIGVADTCDSKKKKFGKNFNTTVALFLFQSQVV